MKIPLLLVLASYVFLGWPICHCHAEKTTSQNGFDDEQNTPIMMLSEEKAPQEAFSEERFQERHSSDKEQQKAIPLTEKSYVEEDATTFDLEQEFYQAQEELSTAATYLSSTIIERNNAINHWQECQRLSSKLEKVTALHQLMTSLYDQRVDLFLLAISEHQHAWTVAQQALVGKMPSAPYLQQQAWKKYQEQYKAFQQLQTTEMLFQRDKMYLQNLQAEYNTQKSTYPEEAATSLERAQQEAERAFNHFQAYEKDVERLLHALNDMEKTSFDTVSSLTEATLTALPAEEIQVSAPSSSRVLQERPLEENKKEEALASIYQPESLEKKSRKKRSSRNRKNKAPETSLEPELTPPITPPLFTMRYQQALEAALQKALLAKGEALTPIECNLIACSTQSYLAMEYEKEKEILAEHAAADFIAEIEAEKNEGISSLSASAKKPKSKKTFLRKANP